MTCEITFIHNLPLNKSNPDLLVNFLQYGEYDASGNRIAYFSWVTDLMVTEENALHLVRAVVVRVGKWKMRRSTR